MTKIAVVYFSGYGHTAKQAEAVRAGAESVTNSVVNVYRIMNLVTFQAVRWKN